MRRDVRLFVRVYIAVDMEGVAGVVNWEETAPGNGDYDRFRRLMTAEADAAAKAAFSAGASEVTINDAHGGMRNLLIEELDPRAELVGGSPKAASMMEGIDEGFDALVMVGFHSRASTPGVLNHTYTASVLEYRVNGRAMGEIGMCAAYAGHHGVPAVFVSGDDAATSEAEDLVPGIVTARVKRYVGRYAARSLNPVRARELISRGVTRALQSEVTIPPLVLGGPVDLELSFVDTAGADAHHLFPGAVRMDPLTVGYTAQDYDEAYRVTRALMMLGSL